jgi:hypothetical protein
MPDFFHQFVFHSFFHNSSFSSSIHVNKTDAVSIGTLLLLISASLTGSTLETKEQQLLDFVLLGTCLLEAFSTNKEGDGKHDFFVIITTRELAWTDGA